MSRVIARVASPRTRISRSNDGNAKCGAQEIALSVQPVFFVSRPQASPNTFRARANRDITVPIGKAIISEI
jgi:hypothetical protein